MSEQGYSTPTRMDDGPDEGSAAASDSAAAASSASATASAVAPSPPNPLLFQIISDPKLRFILELEFVEMLASPHYLHFLAQSRYFSNPAFLRYLGYLQYWHTPEYLPFITHPHALYFLDLLQLEAFRDALLKPGYVNLIHEQSFFHWRSSRYNTYIEAEAKRDAARAAKLAKEQEKNQHGDNAAQILIDAQKGQHGS